MKRKILKGVIAFLGFQVFMLLFLKGSAFEEDD
jgi:hypothetical protein